jgi:hypothetical protein
LTLPGIGRDPTAGSACAPSMSRLGSSRSSQRGSHHAAFPARAITAGTIVIDTGDSRSNGQGPGLVGSPFAIVIGVVLLGLIAAGATLLYLRVADRR